MNNLKESPFQPGLPVSPNKFQGRTSIIEDIKRYIPNVLNGNAQHFFITGNPAMGKTSFANFIGENLEKKYKLLSIIVNNDINDLDSLIRLIIEKLLNRIEKEAWSKKIIDRFTNIEYTGIMNTLIKFKPTHEELADIRTSFPYFLIELI